MRDALSNLLSSTDEIALLWEGNDSWLIKNKDTLISFDLDLFNPERILPCTLNLDLLCKRLDILLITHEHEDHFSSETCKLLNESSNCFFVIPKSCEEKARLIGISDKRMMIVQPKMIFDYHHIHVECVRALHGHIGQSVYSGASLFDCGYLVTMGGKTLYQPGDTVLLEEHTNMPHIDLLFISPTDHNTRVAQSVKIIESINPSYIFPQHHSTYYENEENIFWTHGYVDELFCKLTDKDKKRFIKLSQGDVWSSESRENI